MALRSLSIADLRRELARREANSGKLLKQHKQLTARLATIDAELAELGVDGLPRRRGRPPGRVAGRRGPGRPKGSRNKGGLTLLAAIIKGVRAGATISPAEAAVAARRAGYKSSSPHLAMMCANAMGKSSEFRHAGRGAYVLKSGGKSGTAKSAPKARRARRIRKLKVKVKAKPKAKSRKPARAASPAPRSSTPATKKKGAAMAATAASAAAAAAAAG
jgi:hypothetical protein